VENVAALVAQWAADVNSYRVSGLVQLLLRAVGVQVHELPVVFRLPRADG
jgi:hypothetical protein